MLKNEISTGVFWGSFDPPTIAHAQIITKMQEIFTNVLIIVNNNQSKNYFASAEHRVKMITEILQNNTASLQIYQQNKLFEYDYFSLRKSIGTNLYVTVGIDAVYSWLETNTVDEFAKYDGIYIVPRAGYLCDQFDQFSNIELLTIADQYAELSSTLVRAKLLADPNADFTNMISAKTLKYLLQHNLYQEYF